MKFALIDGVKTKAQPNLVAQCPNCGKQVRSYCGNQIINHWKHIKLNECDTWYERETEWHREWKNHFDIEYQEVIRFDNKTNEKHIADVYNSKKDVVLEFQHSPINTDEIQARELFYNRMIWIIDLTSIKKNLEFINKKFKIETVLNRMSHNLPKDFKVSEEFKMSESQNKVSEYLDRMGISSINTKESHYLSELEKKYTTLCNRKDHFLMTWKHLHKRWDFSTKPKFIDIGDNNIYQLIERIEIGSAYIVKKYSKSHFINHYQ
ncbi:hypothetical protein [Mesoflavibacter zeaxanthinifaciens]|uniref:competence protein CoiA family protein n=1 Tax=Mesoflavibacter zeaxanthinifaciens TaxID=393060 RepID=UPI003A95B93A